MDVKATAFSGLAFYIDLPFMDLDNVLNNGKP